MGKKCFFWKGVRVLGALKSWKPYAIPQSQIERQGTSRVMGAMGGRSRNYLYDIQVRTSVSPRVTLTVGGNSDLDIGPQGVLNLTFLQWQAQIVGLAAGTDFLGDLAWCEDDEQMLTVTGRTNPGSYPGVGTIVYTGSGFTPTVGEKVLIRNKTTGHGFVTEVISAPGGSFTASFREAVDASGWTVYLIRFYYPDTAYNRVEGYENETQSDDKWIPDLTVSFKSQSHPAYPTSYAITPE
jgi:hypothetical protein